MALHTLGREDDLLNHSSAMGWHYNEKDAVVAVLSDPQSSSSEADDDASKADVNVACPSADANQQSTISLEENTVTKPVALVPPDAVAVAAPPLPLPVERARVGDYFAVLRILGGLPLVVSANLVSNMVAPAASRRTFRDTALDSVMGHCYRSSTLRQLRILTGMRPLKEELAGVYYKFSGSARGLQGFNKEFGGGIAQWVHEVPDRTPEDPVLVYFHGGGYALKTCQVQVSYICDMAKAMRHRRLSVLVLDYTITAVAQFPVQRNEALDCLHKLEKSCKNIILFGDSCGANLALSVLLEEEGPEKIDHSKITGCVLVSPWVDPAAHSGSMNSKKDILSKKRLMEMTASFVKPEELDDPRVSPIRADPKTWERVLPKNTCCVWGDLECLADQCEEFCRVAKIKNYCVERNGTHDCILRGFQPEPCKFIFEQILQYTRPAAEEATDKSTQKSTPNKADRRSLRRSLLRSPSLRFGRSSKSSSSLSSSSPSHSTTSLVTPAAGSVSPGSRKADSTKSPLMDSRMSSSEPILNHVDRNNSRWVFGASPRKPSGAQRQKA